PGIREDILRKSVVYVKYFDENFQEHDEQFTGIAARVFQHEYDHIEGIVFVDRIPSLKKMLLKRKLTDISKGDVEVSYKMLFPALKKGRK
ncbi:MAG TPA: peptide deformylase, partial [Bacteroidales bacterium]|nr:peptide deformylase [Bacteroidales bacterium]